MPYPSLPREPRCGVLSLSSSMSIPSFSSRSPSEFDRHCRSWFPAEMVPGESGLTHVYCRCRNTGGIAPANPNDQPRPKANVLGFNHISSFDLLWSYLLLQAYVENVVTEYRACRPLAAAFRSEHGFLWNHVLVAHTHPFCPCVTNFSLASDPTSAACSLAANSDDRGSTCRRC